MTHRPLQQLKCMYVLFTQLLCLQVIAELHTSHYQQHPAVANSKKLSRDNGNPVT